MNTRVGLSAYVTIGCLGYKGGESQIVVWACQIFGAIGFQNASVIIEHFAEETYLCCNAGGNGFGR